MALDVPSHPWKPPFALTSLQEGHFGDVKPHKRGGYQGCLYGFSGPSTGAAGARQATQRHCGVWEEALAPRGESQLTWICQDAVATVGVMGRGRALNWCWNPALTPKAACDPDSDCESIYFPGLSSLWKHGVLVLGSLTKLWVLGVSG